jgi:hypothetical protein
MAVDYIDNGNDDGANIGRSDGKIGFYGLTTPIVKATLTEAIVAGASAAAVNRSIRELQAALSGLGLITTV